VFLLLNVKYKCLIFICFTVVGIQLFLSTGRTVNALSSTVLGMVFLAGFRRGLGADGAYPRVYGGNSDALLCEKFVEGLSPCVRGKP
jgi:hypothetical protein